jgi:solute carrier family 25 (mitochondrial S-adenosylmethionine transporter), member 26
MIFLMFPIDTVKTRVQMGGSLRFTLRSIYAGVGASLIGQVPYGMVVFGSYEIYKDLLIEK